MDRIDLLIKQTDVGVGKPVSLVTILINGRSLIDIIRDVELTFPEVKKHPRLAGSYLGVDTESLHYYHNNGFPGTEGKKALLLQCNGYDDFDCWPILAKVTFENNRVIWSEFEQPHRGPDSKAGHWVYDLTFVFDRQQYEAELSRCHEA